MTQAAPVRNQQTGKVKNLFLWVVQALVAIQFLFSGGMKLAGTEPMLDMYNTIGWGQWFRYFTGVVEVSGAILLLISSTASRGALPLTATMIGALIAHFTVLHTSPTAAIVLLVQLGIVLWGRGLGLPSKQVS
jgi:putative oxidoreductase